MIVLLPPSETKRAGGNGPALDLDRLGFPELTPVRDELVAELVALAADRAASRAALGLSPAQDAEIDRNAALWEAPTMPAIERYTGVLYDALDIGSLTGEPAERARERLVVASALFGLLRADDPIPAYRLSAGSKPPGGPLAPRWRPVLEPVLARLAEERLVVDLRSGAYAGLGRLRSAVTVKVYTEHPDGRRTVVSHFNKAHKGRLARALAGDPTEPTDAAGVARVAREAGMTVEEHGRHELHLIVTA